MTLVMLLVPAAVLTLELAANLERGAGWPAAAHMLVIGPLYVILMGCLWLGVRSALWRYRLHRLQQRRRRSTAADRPR